VSTHSDQRLRGRHLVPVLACVAALAAGLARAAPPEPSARETQIKAAYIYNFTKFIEWPAGTFGSDAAPIVLGTFGDGPLHRELQTLVDGRKINGRPIVVRRVATVPEVTAAQLVYVAPAEDARFAAILPAVRDSAVLTVGESESFLDHGGGIRLLVNDEKLRFEINVDAAERAHLKVSAQLQKLATTVYRQPQT
jgi:YfiR/HmsC-like